MTFFHRNIDSTQVHMYGMLWVYSEYLILNLCASVESLDKLFI